eukprot:CAMPEP_0116954958 /NCGR_PEP_ID=MMETSP0467-20121206/42298_1 /TAXON_ID=283647 /ORGANISM="Mesodinium pulex, Strain SPMC105" /LENGTH=48 /DNA_ID= /DNA_START= /DNA_END= /DNA_ORIENTATION=
MKRGWNKKFKPRKLTLAERKRHDMLIKKNHIIHHHGNPKVNNPYNRML